MAEPKKAEVPVAKPRAIIKVVEIPFNEDYQEPEGYILKDIHNSDSSEKFYGILVKVQEQPAPASRGRMSEPVNLKG